jgi:hypothetical protein
MMTQQDQKVAAGAATVVTVVGAIAALMASLQLAEVRVNVPVVAVLGPWMVVQYAYLRRLRGREQTTREYLQADPIGRRASAAHR